MTEIKKNYIGLAITPHDPAICIVNQAGKIVFSEDAERYLQNKRAWCSPPDDLIYIKQLIKEYCDPSCDLVIALSWQKSTLIKAQRDNFFIDLLAKHALRHFGFANAYYFLRVLNAYMIRNVGINTEYNYRALTNHEVSYKYYNHHLAHAAAACYSSGYESATCAIFDGNGEKNSVYTFYKYENGQYQQIITNLKLQVSLGHFYALICMSCGFNPIEGEEWKVMGLAPYGKLNEEYYSILKSYAIVDGLMMKPTKQSHQFFDLIKKLKRDKDTPALEFADLAYTGQYVFTEFANELLTNLYEVSPSENLVVGGGCGLNSSWIGTIQNRTPYKNSYVFCAPADNGNAVGAALLAYDEDHRQHERSNEIQTPYLGSKMSPRSIQDLMKFSHLKVKANCSMDDVIETTARLLSEGKIVGWIQGRAEFGPRALGNRSILADPRDPHVKEKINDRVKFREEFRPFAPSILHEFGSMYFEDYQETPYMERTLIFKKEVRDKVPGVVHVDGTGRLQTVKVEWNEYYYRLIKAFYQLTDVPILLNTSFNVMGKPIVHSVEDAMAVFMVSGLDILVIENNIIFKS